MGGGTAPAPVPGPPPPPAATAGGASSGRPNVAFAIIGVLLVAVVGLVIALHPWKKSSGSGSAHAPSGVTVQQPVTQPDGGGGTGGGSDSGPSPSSEADQIARLLNASGRLRGRLVTAVSRLDRCIDPAGDVYDLRSIRSGRNDLLQQARGLTTSGLRDGGELRGELVSAFNFSVRADDAFITWGSHIRDQGCYYRSVRSASSSAFNRYDAAASAAKQQVVQLWNPIANEYGLPRYQESEI